MHSCRFQDWMSKDGLDYLSIKLTNIQSRPRAGAILAIPDKAGLALWPNVHDLKSLIMPPPEVWVVVHTCNEIIFSSSPSSFYFHSLGLAGSSAISDQGWRFQSRSCRTLYFHFDFLIFKVETAKKLQTDHSCYADRAAGHWELVTLAESRSLFPGQRSKI